MRRDRLTSPGDFPPLLIARNKAKLRPTKLQHAEHCFKCVRVLTVVAYRDPETGKEWPTCSECAHKAAPPPTPTAVDPDAEIPF